MNATLKTILTVLAGLVVGGGLLCAGALFARTGFLSRGVMMPGYAGNYGGYHYGPGMMNRGGGWAGRGPIGGGRSGIGPGMMGGYGWNNAPSAAVTPLTVEQANQAADKYVQALKISGLATGEVMIFDNNAYVVVKETETGVGAFELLVDPVSQVAYPEYGPNMMWNVKYGAVNHGGMMGGRGSMLRAWSAPSAAPSDVPADMPVTQDQAVKDAQAFLDQYRAGTTASTDPVKFYGYYTLDFKQDGKVSGMLSVNGYSGQVFLHTWHGQFIEEAE